VPDRLNGDWPAPIITAVRWLSGERTSVISGDRRPASWESALARHRQRPAGRAIHRRMEAASVSIDRVGLAGHRR
jgi:hypothetical protein